MKSKDKIKEIVRRIAEFLPNNNFESLIIGQINGFIDYNLNDFQADYILDQIRTVLGRPSD